MISNALQAAIYARLVANAGVAALVSGRVYDITPLDAAFPHISFGPSDIVTDDQECINGRVETVQLDCWSRAQDGFRECKALVDAVKAALHDYSVNLSVGALASMRITLSQVFRDPDGLTSHGVVQVECLVEE